MNINCGIYGIEGNNGDLYVGQADGIKKRWSCHNAHFRKNEHSYEQLQEAFNESAENIKWIILENCSPEMLEEREDWWIKNAGRIDGWNVINKEKFGKSKSKVKDTNKMKEAQAGAKNGHCTKLCASDVVEIKKMLEDGIKQVTIAEKFGVSATLIHNIKAGNRWASVGGVL